MSRALIPNILPHPYLHERWPGSQSKQAWVQILPLPGYVASEKILCTSLSLREHTGNASLQGALTLYSQLKCRQPGSI